MVRYSCSVPVTAIDDVEDDESDGVDDSQNGEAGHREEE